MRDKAGDICLRNSRTTRNGHNTISDATCLEPWSHQILTTPNSAFRHHSSRVETERKTQKQSPIQWTRNPKAQRAVLEVDNPSCSFGEIPQSVQYLGIIERIQFAKYLKKRHFPKDERDLVPFGFQDDPLFPLLKRQIGGYINFTGHRVTCRMLYGFAISSYR